MGGRSGLAQCPRALPNLSSAYAVRKQHTCADNPRNGITAGSIVCRIKWDRASEDSPRLKQSVPRNLSFRN